MSLGKLGRLLLLTKKPSTSKHSVSGGSSQELKKSHKNLENVVIRMEKSHGDKLDALFDGWKQNTDQLKRHEEKLESIDRKLEKHEVEITVINGGKSKRIKE